MTVADGDWDMDITLVQKNIAAVAAGWSSELAATSQQLLRGNARERQLCCQQRPSAQSQLFDPGSLRISSANRFWESFEPS